jgi:hypothetical protein
VVGGEEIFGAGSADTSTRRAITHAGSLTVVVRSTGRGAASFGSAHFVGATILVALAGRFDLAGRLRPSADTSLAVGTVLIGRALRQTATRLVFGHRLADSARRTVGLFEPASPPTGPRRPAEIARRTRTVAVTGSRNAFTGLRVARLGGRGALIALAIGGRLTESGLRIADLPARTVALGTGRRLGTADAALGIADVSLGAAGVGTIRTLGFAFAGRPVARLAGRTPEISAGELGRTSRRETRHACEKRQAPRPEYRWWRVGRGGAGAVVV